MQARVLRLYSGHHRQLTPRQLALLAVDLLPLFEEEAKQRQREHGGTAPGKKNTSANSAEVSPQGRTRDEVAALIKSYLEERWPVANRKQSLS